MGGGEEEKKSVTVEQEEEDERKRGGESFIHLVHFSKERPSVFFVQREMGGKRLTQSSFPEKKV